MSADSSRLTIPEEARQAALSAVRRIGYTLTTLASAVVLLTFGAGYVTYLHTDFPTHQGDTP